MAVLQPVTLTGDVVTLEPLQHDHVGALATAASDGRLWELWYTGVPTREGMAADVEDRLAQQDAGRMLPFVVRRLSDGVVVGESTYCNAEPEVPRLEIGHTWYSKRVQRTAINTECKLLLLTHAFEVLGCIAVEFRTHWFNQASRVAIERLGAKQDGVLRNHQLMPDGSRRDTVVFSIVDGEWPAVRRHLEHLLDRPG